MIPSKTGLFFFAFFLFQSVQLQHVTRPRSICAGSYLRPPRAMGVVRNHTWFHKRRSDDAVGLVCAALDPGVCEIGGIRRAIQGQCMHPPGSLSSRQKTPYFHSSRTPDLARFCMVINNKHNWTLPTEATALQFRRGAHRQWIIN